MDFLGKLLSAFDKSETQKTDTKNQNNTAPSQDTPTAKIIPEPEKPVKKVASTKSSDEDPWKCEVPKIEEIYIPDKKKVQPVDVPIIELSEKQTVEAGWSYRKKSKSIRITNYHGTEKNLIIPSKIGGIPVNEIGARAFMRSKIESIEIPSSVKKIRHKAFAESEVMRIVIGEGVRDIEYNAFFRCEYLYEINLPTTLKSIGNHAFELCRSLDYIMLPGSLDELGSEVFSASGLCGFSAESRYALKDGSIFANTPMHNNYKMIATLSNSPEYIYILLVGVSANIKFKKNSRIALGKNSICAGCCLDFSECKKISFDNCYGGKRDTHGIYYSFYLCRAIVPFGTNDLYFPEYVTVQYPDGSRYKGITEFLEQEGNYDYIKVKINGNTIPSWYMKTGAKKISIDNLHCIVDKYAFKERNMKSLEFKGQIVFNEEIFSPYCDALHEVKWRGYAGIDTDIEKFIPPLELVGRPIHQKLLTAFTMVHKDKPRVFGAMRHGYENYFFDSTVIDDIFSKDYFEYTDWANRKHIIKLNQRKKILIAIDVLRSTQRSCDSDTKMYSDYLRTHKRYAAIVCERIKADYPEYGEYFYKLDF